MSYWQYAPPYSPGHPLGAFSSPPLSSYYSPRASPYSHARTHSEAYAYAYPTHPRARYHYEYVPVYEDVTKGRTHRQADYYDTPSARRTSAQPRQSSSSYSSAPRQATPQDCLDAGIPAGYSTKNWDPTEEPIFLLGSVFDANSLGKWIYDWTVYRHGADTVELEAAGDLWLSLIALSGKMRQAEDLLRRREKSLNRRRIKEFLVEGDELLERFRALLQDCESSMMRVAQRDHDTGRVVAMGSSSGCEFVDCIFGEDRGLQETEDLIDAMVRWEKGFDAMFNKKSRKRRSA